MAGDCGGRRYIAALTWQLAIKQNSIAHQDKSIYKARLLKLDIRVSILSDAYLVCTVANDITFVSVFAL